MSAIRRDHLAFSFFSLSLPPRHRAIYFFNVCNELNVFPRDLPFFSVVFPFTSRCYQSPPRTPPFPLFFSLLALFSISIFLHCPCSFASPSSQFFHTLRIPRVLYHFIYG